MKYLKFVFIFPMIVISGDILASDEWYHEGGAHALLMQYNGSDYYRYLTGIGAYIKSDYLERRSYIIGINYNNKQYKSSINNVPSRMIENVFYLGMKSNKYLDTIPGRLTFRLDGYLGQDNYLGLTTNTSTKMSVSTNRVSVKDGFIIFNPVVSYLKNDKSLYMDLGYAISRYTSNDSSKYNVNIMHPKLNIISTSESSDDITIFQWSPTIGMGFDHAINWLQIRAYLIKYSSSNRVNYKKSTSAIEAKLTHWFAENHAYGLDSISLNILGGQRIYAVDYDSYTLYNSADMQKNSIALGLKWILRSRLNLFMHYGHDNYEDLVDNDSYENNYLFFQLSGNWQ